MTSPSTTTAVQQFAFANLKGHICLVQVTVPPQGAMASALMASDVRVFRHEFITIFRYSHSTSVHPADIRVLERIDERGALYEEDKGTVFLARDAMDRMQKLSAAAASSALAVGGGMRRRSYAHAYAMARPARVRLEVV